MGLLLFTQGGGYLYLGLLVFALVGVWIYTELSGAVAGGVLDRQGQEVAEGAVERANLHLGLPSGFDPEIPPIVAHGYDFQPIFSPVLAKKGKDDVNRASNYSVMVLQFGEDKVYAYTHRFSFIKRSEVTEFSNEFYYEEVVGLSSETQSINVPDVSGKGLHTTSEVLSLTNVAGTSVSSPVNGSSGVNGLVRAARSMLDEKRGQGRRGSRY